jgi:microcystin-dependent protein
MLFCPHNHDRLYASKSHKHDDRYSLLGHTHEGTSRIVGEITIWATDTAPTGWLLCYGQTVLRSTALGTLLVNAGCPFGTGDGSTTVNLPDLRGRMPLGQDDMGGSSANRITAGWADTIGGAGGAETHTLSIPEIPAHHHHTNGYGPVLPLGSVYYLPYESGTNVDLYATKDAGGGQAHNNLQPGLTLNFIIYSG